MMALRSLVRFVAARPGLVRPVSALLGAACAALALAACPAPDKPARHPTPDEPRESSSLKLEVWARVEGQTSGPLGQGMTLRPGDRIFVQAKVTKKAYVYVLHCDTEQKLELLPTTGPVEFESNQKDDLPEPGNWFVVDGHAGNDVIYVIASERRLERADPTLAETIAEAGRGASVDCSRGKFEDVLSGLPSTPLPGSTSTPPAPQPSPSVTDGQSPQRPGRSKDERPGKKQGPRDHTTCGRPEPCRPPVSAAKKQGPRDHTTRGTTVQGGSGARATRADEAGIAVVRLPFRH
jgi:Domain of unknown function (DUF4384)